MTVRNKAPNGSKVVRRFIEYTVIGASCLYLGVQVYNKRKTDNS